MSYLEVSEEELLLLSANDSEELIARLAEAEVKAQGLSANCVHRSGNISAPDGGVDVRVIVDNDDFQPGYIPKNNTIFQVKMSSMPPNKIKNEMCKNGKLSQALSKQDSISGAYIIVSLKDNCPNKEDRIAAMQNAFDVNTKNDIYVDFYDRSKICQWLRQYELVELWVRTKLQKPNTGWRPYGRWSKPPFEDDDAFILDTGVSISLPQNRDTKLSIMDAIDPMRDLVKSSKKTIRIVGLSGIGKTRIVQALFEENIGSPLDKDIAIYTDTGENPEPPVKNMLDNLVNNNQEAILVVDNCPSSLHTNLVHKIKATNTNVRLITVEYDIRDDIPQQTEVIHIEADGHKIAEKLLLRRYPHIDFDTARKIAKFSGGNARIALVIGETAKHGESLAHLSDDDLFNRIFYQKNQDDKQLREHAQLLSLVYSFSVEAGEDGTNELDVLCSLGGIHRNKLYRSVSTLLKRQVAQERSRWRAILPQAIANRLATEALESIEVQNIREVFEGAGRERLLKSFARRLGLIPENRYAKTIVRSWLENDGLFGAISSLNECKLRTLEFATPVEPDLVLDYLEKGIKSQEFSKIYPPLDSRRIIILNLLTALAYDSDKFDRCVELLLHLFDFENESYGYGTARERIDLFFQPYLSGTHASIDQRLFVLQNALESNHEKLRTFGLKMLCTALDGPPWSNSFGDFFGGQIRDYGSEPNYGDLVEWRCRFIDLAVIYGLSEDKELARNIRQILADNFDVLWEQPEIWDKLVDSAKKLNSKSPWILGYHAVKRKIYNYQNPKDDKETVKIPPELEYLEEILRPTDLKSRIECFVIGEETSRYSVDPKDPGRYVPYKDSPESIAESLGIEFAKSEKSISSIGSELFFNSTMHYGRYFGRGLAIGASNKQSMWDELVSGLNQFGRHNSDLSIHKGYIEQIESINRFHAQKILDSCLDHPKLRKEILDLHPINSFEESDLDRCIKALNFKDVSVEMYSELFWVEQYSSLPPKKLLDLALLIQKKPNGDEIILHGFYMKLFPKNLKIDVLGKEFRRIGLVSVIRLIKSQKIPDYSTRDNMRDVIEACLQFKGNRQEKSTLLDAISDVLDGGFGKLNPFIKAVGITAKMMPIEFMNRIFMKGGEERRRLFSGRNWSLQFPVLSEIDIDILINWCQEKKDQKIWINIALGLQLWNSNHEIYAEVVKFLEASPVPEDTIRALVLGISPHSHWGGSLEKILEGRLSSLEDLKNDTNGKIQLAIQKGVDKSKDIIRERMEIERSTAKEIEQRFE